mmetsp:Transcript_56128/g.177849  ORF Transcript_56128/g.177849 Transcript_56128/m.177849 type:complete len:126 (-) Transcript_56128:15-392(-)
MTMDHDVSLEDILQMAVDNAKPPRARRGTRSNGVQGMACTAPHPPHIKNNEPPRGAWGQPLDPQAHLVAEAALELRQATVSGQREEEGMEGMEGMRAHGGGGQLVPLKRPGVQEAPSPAKRHRMS